MAIQTRVRAHIRWMIRRDLPQVAQIESIDSENHWSLEELEARLRVRTCISMVCVDPCDTVLAYMMYEPHKNHLRVVNFTVNPKFRRRSVGKHMIEKLQCKLSERRPTLELLVREGNLAAQLFLKRMGFECDEIVKDWFVDDSGSEHAYHFVYNLATP